MNRPRQHIARSPAPILVGVLLALTACAPSREPLGRSPVRTSMVEHYVQARDMRTFAVTGEDALLRLSARELAEAEETWGLPPGSAPFVAELRRAALQAVSAPSPAEATRAAARVALRCGDCHVASDATLGERFQSGGPLTDGSAGRHMNRLAWVSRMLWDGLVGPSERTWRRGAEALSESEAFPDEVGAASGGDAANRAWERLRALGGEALETEDPEERARLLARVWNSCADCHTRSGVR